MTSAFKPYRPSVPRAGDAESVRAESTRFALSAIVGSFQAGTFMPGWDYSTSVSRGEEDPGTAARPARIYFAYQRGENRILVKVELTWGTTLISSAAFHWSDDDGESFDTLRDEDGNYVASFTYDADLNMTSYAWSGA